MAGQETSRPRIGIIVNGRTNLAYAQEVVEGMLRYAAIRPWEIVRKRGLPVLFWDDLAGFEGEGLIAQAITSEQLRRLKRTALPAVNVSSASRSREVPSVCVDNAAIGRMGARHLIDLGFDELAFVGVKRWLYSVDRAGAFCTEAESAGKHCRILWVRPRRAGHLSPEGSTLDREALNRVVADLPNRVGVMAANDSISEAVTSTLQTQGRSVPDDVAVLGVDNSRLICETGRPTLSSIDANQQQVGYEAAQLLDDLLLNKPDVRQSHYVFPRGVVSRQSTDVLAISDPQVVTAIRYIRAHAHRPLQVPEVVAATNCSRRPLENRFKKHRGRTLLQEIHHTQIELSRNVLLETDIPITQIHEHCGFRSYQRFQQIFKNIVSETPSQFRATYLNGPGHHNR